MKLRDLGRGISFGTLMVGALFVTFCAVALLMPAQNDTYWHLRAGQDIWRTHQIPRVDHYSHTFPGAPWPDHEWLAQAFMYGIFRAGGMPGLEIAAALLVMGAAVLSFRLMVGTRATRATLMSIALVLSSCVWVLRPHVLTFFLLALLTTLVARARWRWIPPLFLVWANAHGGVVLGGLVLAATWAAALLRWWRVGGADDRARAGALTVVLVLSGLACAAAPLGFGIYRFVIESTARSMQVKILEWFPVKPVDFFGVLFWAATVGFAALLVLRGPKLLRQDPPAPWASWAVVAAGVALLPLAVRSLRNTAPFILLAAPAATCLLGADFRMPAAITRFFKRKQPREPSPERPRLNLAILTGLSVLATASVAVLLASSPPTLAWHPFSDAALAATRSCEGPLYNHYGDGGTLIWFLPEKPVFVDGRQDPYPLDFLLDIVDIEDGKKPYRPMFDRFHIKCAFLPADTSTVDELAAEGWTTRYRDKKYVVMSAPPAR